MAERMSVDYGKKGRFSFTVYPSPQLASSIVEPYNAVLCTHSMIEQFDAVIVLDNEALYRVC